MAHGFSLLLLQDGRRLDVNGYIEPSADASIKKDKARLLALACRQRYGLDFQETFAPVAKRR